MVAVAGLLFAPTATGQAPPEKVFTGADISRAGRIDLTVFAPGGSVATYYERRASDPDRWLAGMRRLQAKVFGALGGG